MELNQYITLMWMIFGNYSGEYTKIEIYALYRY